MRLSTALRATCVLKSISWAGVSKCFYIRCARPYGNAHRPLVSHGCSKWMYVWVKGGVEGKEEKKERRRRRRWRQHELVLHGLLEISFLQRN